MNESTPINAGAQGAPEISDSGIYNPLQTPDSPACPPSSSSIREERTDGRKSEPVIRFWRPCELRDYEIPEGHNMVGDFHFQRGSCSVLAGPPGCGKSRATLWLALLGARGGGKWFGHEVHTHFRTLILQGENGPVRLHRDFAQIEACDELEDWIRISEPPTLGLNLANPDFRAQLCAYVREFKPGLIVLDPWNSVARDSMEKDYLAAFESIREVLATVEPKPACLIVHHLRKPKAEDKQRGRSLAHLMAGSYTILSVPRSAFILQPASDDTEDDRVVFTTAKNNDGELGARSAWKRGGSMFEPCSEFSWEDYDGGSSRARESKVGEEHIRELFDNGNKWLLLSEAARQLMELARIARTAAYEALKLSGGRFSELLTMRDDKRVGLA